MTGTYILNGQTPEHIKDIVEWGRWFETADLTVAETKVGKVTVSTVFLGLDHSFGGGTPILFETMILGGKEHGYQERYASLEESMIGHERAVVLARQANNRLQWTLRRIGAWLKDRLFGSRH